MLFLLLHHACIDRKSLQCLHGCYYVVPPASVRETGQHHLENFMPSTRLAYIKCIQTVLSKIFTTECPDKNSVLVTVDSKVSLRDIVFKSEPFIG